MARNWGFLYFLVSLTTVLCSLTISTLDVEENYYDVEFDSTQRSKRDVDTTEHIIWRDNHETAKLGAKNVTPTIKRVVHHGIYPSLEIEVPINLNGNSASKTTRSARSVQQGDQYRTHGEERDKNPQIPIRITYQAVYPPAIRNISGSSTYARAAHPPPGGNINYYTRQRVGPPGGNRTQYRTLYFPETGRNFTGDPQNKGRVRLVSAAYYSVNGSRDDLRSFSNPPVKKRVARSNVAISPLLSPIIRRRRAVIRGSDRVQSIRSSDRAPSIRRSDRVPSIRSSDRAPSIRSSDRVPSIRRSDRAPSIGRSDRVPSIRRSDRVPSIRSSDLAPSIRSSNRAPSIRRSDRVQSIGSSDRAPSIRRSDRVPSIRRSDRAPSIWRSDWVPSIRMKRDQALPAVDAPLLNRALSSAETPHGAAHDRPPSDRESEGDYANRALSSAETPDRSTHDRQPSDRESEFDYSLEIERPHYRKRYKAQRRVKSSKSHDRGVDRAVDHADYSEEIGEREFPASKGRKPSKILKTKKYRKLPNKLRKSRRRRLKNVRKSKNGELFPIDVRSRDRRRRDTGSWDWLEGVFGWMDDTSPMVVQKCKNRQNEIEMDDDSKMNAEPIDCFILIQAPPRKIYCKPPRRFALGRCRPVL
ncbi:Hypothetical protein NTJ_11934 [Nesidiocoris tenuis]|uniref:Uncharacterized protein n=1 Tax=Nesidiocoris tenuis TaxID=355587 RepID=A0ABN7B3Z0_9HEMI|nr:Hypothetical protein NTJ_11934 [Nesidiocoris tenuis]